MNPTFLLKLLVETESPSCDKAAVDRVSAIVAEEARQLGAHIEIISNKDVGNHVLARFSPNSQPSTPNLKPITLLCHMDTVFPLGTLEKMPYREADGKIFGPGALDMKAGIVVALAALAKVQQNGLSRPVTLLCTSDEEIGSLASREHIERLARESAVVFVLESALVDGSLKTWRKGGGTFWVKTRGRAAHAGGDHEKGRNAIEEMAHQVLAIQKLTDYTTGTTLNVGVIQGGTVSNVVPDEASIEVDVRILQPGEWERVEAAMRALRPVLDGTSIEVSGRLNRGPMPFDDRMKATYEKVKAIGARLGMDLKAGGSGGVSDANFVAALGIPVLDGLGPAGEGYHSEREYLFADSLFERIELLAALLQNW
ncbi:MAG: M20 family metallopeptidase [Anaerolineales bacterium]